MKSKYKKKLESFNCIWLGYLSLCGENLTHISEHLFLVQNAETSSVQYKNPYLTFPFFFRTYSSPSFIEYSLRLFLLATFSMIGCLFLIARFPYFMIKVPTFLCIVVLFLPLTPKCILS